MYVCMYALVCVQFNCGLIVKYLGLTDLGLRIYFAMSLYMYIYLSIY